jgi:hypothetical protein
MFFPDVAFMGVNPQELLELVQSNENYLQLSSLLSTSLENKIPPTNNSQFVDLLKITAQKIALKNREALKSASAANDFFDNEFAFKYKRNGNVEWSNPAPIFASMGFEVQNEEGIPLTEPIIINPSQWVFAPTSILTWLLDNSIFSTNKKQIIKLDQNGEYVFVFTNGNEKGKASEAMYNEVKNTNNAAFVTSVVLFVVPFALKKYFKEKKCATELTKYFTQQATVLRDRILSGTISQGRKTTEILKIKDGFNELIVNCANETGNNTTGIFKKFNDFIQTVFNSLDPLDDAESVANLYSLARDFYGSHISGNEVRYFYNGVSFGELDYQAVSETTFSGLPETEHQYEAKVNEIITRYEVERGILSSEFIRKDSLGNTNELPFRAILIEGDATILDANPKVTASALISDFQMGKDTSIIKIEPDFPYKEIIPDTIRLFPGNDLKQSLIENGPWTKFNYESTSAYKSDLTVTFKEGGILEFTSLWVDLDDKDDRNYAENSGSWSTTWGVINEKVIWWMEDGEVVYALLSSISEKAITIVDCCDVFNECRDCGEDEISSDTYVSTKNK